MKKLAYIMIPLLLLSMVVTTITNETYIKNKINSSAQANLEMPRIRILQASTIKYIDYLGPTAIILTHHEDYWQDKIYRFSELVKDRFKNTTIIISNSDPMIKMLYDYPDKAQFFAYYADLYILLNPYDSPLEQEEIIALQSAFENGKSVMITGNYYSYFEPEYLNPLTSKYGVTWFDDQVEDQTDYDHRTYYPLIHTWKTNEIAAILTNGVSNVKTHRSTALNVSTEVNGTEVIQYIIGTGDSDTYVDYNSDVIAGENIIVYMAILHNSGGKMFLSGSTSFLTDGQYYIESFDNELFVNNTLNWFKQDIKVYPNNISVPEILPIGQSYSIYINITNEDSTDRDVNVSLSIINLDSNANVELDQNLVQLGTISAGSYKNFYVNAQAHAPGKVLLLVQVTAKSTTEPNDVITYQKVVPLEAVSLKVSLSPQFSLLSLAKKNKVNVTVTVENPTPIDSTNTKLFINVKTGDPSGFKVTNTTIDLGTITAGTSKQVEVELEFTKEGDYEVAFSANSTEFTEPSTAIFKAKVYSRPVAIFDNYHPTYYTAYRLKNLTLFLNESFDVWLGIPTI